MATGGNLRVARAALALAAAALLAACVAAQMPPGAFGGSRPTFTAVKSDLPYIRCGVCEALAKNAYRQVKTAREALRPGKKLSEGAIQDMMERMADPAKAEGEWVAMVDLVEDGPRLRLAEQAKLGKCGAECKTVQRAAAELLEAHDTDMAERLFQARQTRAQFSNWLCHEASGVCKAKAPPLPAGRTPGPAFEVIDPKEAELEKMLAGMKILALSHGAGKGGAPAAQDAGLGGQVYDRETLMRGMDGMGGMPGMPGMGDEDDDDDDDDLPLGRAPPRAGAGGPSAAPGAPQGKSALEARSSARRGARGQQGTLDKVRGAAGAAVGSAREGLASALEGAKGIIGGLAGGGAAEPGAQTGEL